jgi:hypothetical protein
MSRSAGGASERPATRISMANNPEKNVDGDAAGSTQSTDGGDVTRRPRVHEEE